MSVDPDKLRQFADTLTDDQIQLLREGLAEGGDLHPDKLAATLSSEENQGVFKEFASGRAVMAEDGGVDGGVDGGAGDGGSTKPPPPPKDEPMSRW
jgi:hypothetical protein